jgi:putative ABC transport system ATP-binding protein
VDTLSQAASDPSPAVVRTEAVGKRYRSGAAEVWAVRDVSLDIVPGEVVAIVGPSGSGKTTLLNLLGALDHPTAGSVWFGDRTISSLSDDEAADFRRRRVGFVFQFFNLLPEICAWENVAVPALLDGERLSRARPRAERLLADAGVDGVAERRPDELSGGEQQRVAVARALMLDPPLVLADEPTGNLDSDNGTAILALFRTIAAEGRAVVVATHDASVSDHADRVIELRDGNVVARTPSSWAR